MDFDNDGELTMVTSCRPVFETQIVIVFDGRQIVIVFDGRRIVIVFDGRQI